MSVGEAAAWSWATSAAILASSLGTLQRSPVGRTSDIELGFGHINTNKELGLRHTRLLAGPTLQDTGSMAPDNCSGSGSSGRDDPGSPTVSTDLRGIGLSRPGSG